MAVWPASSGLRLTPPAQVSAPLRRVDTEDRLVTSFKRNKIIGVPTGNTICTLGPQPATSSHEFDGAIPGQIEFYQVSGVSKVGVPGHVNP
jgi:hypothetical protein